MTDPQSRTMLSSETSSVGELPTPTSPTSEQQQQTRFQYRGLGVGLNKTHEVNPLRMFLSSPKQNNTDATRSRQNSSAIFPLEGSLETRTDEDERWHDVERLFDQYEQLQVAFKTKLQNLEQIHDEMSQVLQRASPDFGKSTARPYLPTPNDDDEDYTNGDRKLQSQHGTAMSKFSDIPSSPESYTSQTSQLEIDINERLSRMSHADPHNRDIMKLKNVATSMVELMRFEIADEDGIIKLMNMNDDVHIRSERVVRGFDKLLGSFSI